jgi:glycosyltransferase involved in cell wall biosynthesis
VLNTEHQPWLSILLPVYNVAPYLKDCINSILIQQEMGVEVIALDDCSKDDSLATLQTLSAEHPNQITLLTHIQNGGLSAARNTLLNAANGTYVWFIDSDDAISSTAISELKKIVDTHKPDIVLCDFSIWRENQKLKHRLRGENHLSTFAGKAHQLGTDKVYLFENLYRKRQLHTWSKIAKRQLWGDDLRFPEGKLMEDMVTTPRLILRCESYYYCPRPWVKYRQREGSILATTNQKKIDDSSNANLKIIDEWKAHFPHFPKTAQFHFAHFCVKIHIGVMRDIKKVYGSALPDLHPYRERFFEQIRMTKQQLCLEYIKRGWIMRMIRFLREY